MKRKNLLKQIFTSVLGVVMLFATTGIHLSIHTCRMAEITPEIECETCSTAGDFESSNFESASRNDILKISSEMNPCCTFKNIGKKVDDKFVTIKVEEKLISSVKLFYPQVSILPDVTKYLSDKNLCINFSPPFLINDEKYITNSVFLI